MWRLGKRTEQERGRGQEQLGRGERKKKDQERGGRETGGRLGGPGSPVCQTGPGLPHRSACAAPWLTATPRQASRGTRGPGFSQGDQCVGLAW